MRMFNPATAVALALVFSAGVQARDAALPIVGNVAGQPLAAGVERLIEAFEFLGRPLPDGIAAKLRGAAAREDAVAIQRTLDPLVLFAVHINPELRVKVAKGPGAAELYQGGFTPLLVKIHNEGEVTRRLNIASPQAGPVYRGAALNSLKRQQQTELAQGQDKGDRRRFLQAEMFGQPPMTERLSGLQVEYAIALIYSRDAGKREATIAFDIGQGTQDLGFRGQTPVLFRVKPAVPVKLDIIDHDGKSTVAKLTIRDAAGNVYPPQAKRLAPDFFFQPQIYRADGETILLPSGPFSVTYSRGPEYLPLTRAIEIADQERAELRLELKRWIDPSRFGFYSGDHHIHAAGCAHYQSPTQGVTPEDMFRQVKGEGLNVGCVLTWGPCFDLRPHQEEALEALARMRSEGKTIALLTHAQGAGKTVAAISDVRVSRRRHLRRDPLHRLRPQNHRRPHRLRN